MKTKRSKRLNDLIEEIEKTIFEMNQEGEEIEKNLKTNSFN